MPLVINISGGGHTQTHSHTDVRTETILEKQACLPVAGTLGLIMCNVYLCLNVRLISKQAGVIRDLLTC